LELEEYKKSLLFDSDLEEPLMMNGIVGDVLYSESKSWEDVAVFSIVTE
jgi:hypothetical protein